MKKILIILAAVLVLLPFFSIAAADSQPVDIYFFYGEGCPHCVKEKAFLQQLQLEYGSELRIHYYEVYYNPDNVKLLKELAKVDPVLAMGVPMTLIGDQHIIGYGNDATTGKQIRSLISQCQAGLLGKCLLDQVLNGEPKEEEPKESFVPPVKTNQNLNQPVEEPKEPEAVVATEREITVSVPFLGQIDATKFSLPALSVILGLLDGFNPCAMWVLVFLISLLFGIESVPRRWLIGVVFILASGIVYFLFMTAWLQAFLFLSYLWFIRLVIATFAIIFGFYNLRDYWKARKEGLTCKVTSSEKRQRIFGRLKLLVQEKNLWLALVGIAALAFAVNLVELACSAGFPAVFTSVLAYSGLPNWQYYAYILVYILFFMIDDMLIFSIAMITLHTTNLGTKYVKYSKLIGGLVIFILGLVLMFRPAWLMFG